MATSSIEIPTQVNEDPNKTPKAGITGDDKSAAVDPAAAAAAAAAAAQRPAWLPEKFKSAEEMAKAYTELEKVQSQKTPAAATQPTPEQTKAAVEKAGLDVTKLNQEYKEHGKLSDETLTALEAKGITRDMVSAYISGLSTQASQFRTALAEVAGGEDALKSVYEWAGTSLSPEEIEAYNATVQSGNQVAARMALQGIMSRYTAANGKEPGLLNGDIVPGADGAKPFQSNQQVIDAMRDPRYQTDEAYRQDVAKRMAKTELFGIRG